MILVCDGLHTKDYQIWDVSMDRIPTFQRLSKHINTNFRDHHSRLLDNNAYTCDDIIDRPLRDVTGMMVSNAGPWLSTP